MPAGYTKIRMFAFADPAASWTADGDAWKRRVVPVYREPQGDWAQQDSHPENDLYFVPKTQANPNTDPNDLVFSDWMRSYWDAQAGRWVLFDNSAIEVVVKLPSDGIAGRTTASMTSGICTIQEVTPSTGAFADKTIGGSPATITCFNLSPNELEGTDPRDGSSPMYASAEPKGGVMVLSPLPWTTEPATVQSDTRWNTTGLQIEQWSNLPMPVKTKDAWETVAEREPC